MTTSGKLARGHPPCARWPWLKIVQFLCRGCCCQAPSKPHRAARCCLCYQPTTAVEGFTQLSSPQAEAGGELESRGSQVRNLHTSLRHNTDQP